MILNKLQLRLRSRPQWLSTNIQRYPFSCTYHLRDIIPTSLTTLSNDELLLQDSVKKLALNDIQPLVHKMDENEQMNKSIINTLFNHGLMGIEVDSDYGGSGFNFTAVILAIEELAKIDPSVSVMCDVQNTLVCTVFNKYANEDQKSHYLPLLTSSKVKQMFQKIGSFCLSEESSGSDAFALKTKAKKVDNGYILNGSKMWITNAAEAEIFLIFANVNPELGYKGITCFIVDKDQGIEISKKEQKLGIRASSTCQLNIDDVFVRDDQVMGEVGKGYKIAIDILNEGRIGIAAQMVGLSQGAFDKAVPYTYTRHQFNQPIANFQSMQFGFSDCLTKIEAARLLTYNAARLKDERKEFTKEAAMAKYYSSKVAQEVSGSAIEWAGGIGFTRESGIEKFWRDSKIGAIYEGTSNIQLATIAKFIKKQYEP